MESYITKMMKSIGESKFSIDKKTKQQLNSLLLLLGETVANTAFQLCDSAGRKKINMSMLQNSVAMVLPEKVFQESSKFADKLDRESRVFPEHIFEKILRKNGNSLAKDVKLYLTLTIQYLCGEMLKLAMEMTSSRKKVRITEGDLSVALQNNDAYNQILQKNNIQLMSNHVVPDEVSPDKQQQRIKKAGKLCYLPGKRAAKDIQKYQADQNLIVPKQTFKNVVQEMLNRQKVSPIVYEHLQGYIENYVVSILAKSNRVIEHAKKKKVTAGDIQLVLSILEQELPEKTTVEEVSDVEN
jgi:histone H3/H4